MEVLYFLIPLSLVFVGLGIGIFFWAVKSGQYEDLEGPAHRILFDDDQPVRPPAEAEEDVPEAAAQNRDPKTG